MNEIKALEELRKLPIFGGKVQLPDGEYTTTTKPMACVSFERIEEIADEIEAEIAERFVELPEGWTGEQASDVLAYWPTWDDGSPCMFGDEFTCYPKYDQWNYMRPGGDGCEEYRPTKRKIAATLGCVECERVKHGTKPDGTPRYRCSVCGYGLGDYRWAYCPKCGARIREAVKR